MTPVGRRKRRLCWVHRAPVLGLVCALASVSALWFAHADVVLAAPTVDELADNVRAAVGARPVEMGFRQDVTLQVLFLKWRFHADVYRRGDEIELTVYDAPRFLEDDVSVSLLEVSEGFDHFDLRLVDEIRRNGDVFYVLEGEARAAGGARGGKIWVNGRTWLVEQAVLDYPWGSLTLEQTFQSINGYIVLREQQASVNRLGAQMTVLYSNYWFADED